MSAAEKLREMQRLQVLEGRFPKFPEQGVVLSVLSQIVVAVEAAEVHARQGTWASKVHLQAALDALDEALG